MVATDPGRQSWRAFVCALSGILLAGAVGAWLLADAGADTGAGPNAPLRQLLGSFLVLLAVAGAYLLFKHRAGAAGGAFSRSRGRAPGLPPAMRRRLLVAAALLGWTFVLSIWFRDLAFSHDHAEHCFKAYHFWKEMLGRGRLRGWSHYLAFGYPSGELTPFGPELWVALFRAATLGRLSWTRTYELAFAGVVVFSICAVYVFTRRFFGRATAIIASVVWALDPGDWFQGGWFWFEWLGVWPVVLATSFTMLALIKLSDVIDPGAPPDGRRGDVLWAAFWILASLITHQLPIIVYAVTLPCLVAAKGLRREQLSRDAAFRLGAAVVLGFGLAAFYLVPMFARSALTQDLGVAGLSLDELAHRLVEMRLFEKGWSPIVVLGLLGCVSAVRGGTASGLFFALSCAVFVLLSSDLLVGVLHAERLFSAILKIECQRMLLVAKLFWFPLAAHAAVAFVRRPPGAPARPPSRVLVAGALVLASALAAPLLKPAAVYLFHAQIAKDLEVWKDHPLATGFSDFLRWTRAERKATATDEPYRIAYTLRNPHDHTTAISPVFNDTYLYRVGYTSAQQFLNFPMSDEPELFEALSVKYVVSDHDLTGATLAFDRSFGELRVYRFKPYRARHPFTLHGEGQAELVQFAPERIHIRLRGTNAETRLKLHVAVHPRWRASIDGRQVPISPATVHGIEYPILMEVPARDGDLVFEYTNRAIDWTGLVVTLLALGAFSLLAARRVDPLLRRRRVARAAAALARVAPALRRAAPAVAVLLLAAAVWKMASPARLPPSSLLAIAPPASELRLAGEACHAIAPTTWQCGENQVRAAVVSGSFGSHFCLTASGAGPLVFSADTRLGRFVRASYDAVGWKTGRFRVLADGLVLGDTPTRTGDQGLQFLQIDTRARAGQDARLRFEMEGGALNCFQLQVVR